MRDDSASLTDYGAQNVAASGPAGVAKTEKKVGGVWYLLLFFLLIIGGLIASRLNKERDKANLGIY